MIESVSDAFRTNHSLNVYPPSLNPPSPDTQKTFSSPISYSKHSLCVCRLASSSPKPRKDFCHALTCMHTTLASIDRLIDQPSDAKCMPARFRMKKVNPEKNGGGNDLLVVERLAIWGFLLRTNERRGGGDGKWWGKKTERLSNLTSAINQKLEIASSALIKSHARALGLDKQMKNSRLIVREWNERLWQLREFGKKMTVWACFDQTDRRTDRINCYIRTHKHVYIQTCV